MGYMRKELVLTQLDYLAGMTPSKALAETARLRASAENALLAYQEELAAGGLLPHYDLDKLIDVMQFFARKVRMVRSVDHKTGEYLADKKKIVPEENTPKDYLWLNEKLHYWSHLNEFDHSSNEIIMIAAFYMGNTLVKNFPQLCWGLGKKGKYWRYPNHPSVLWPKKDRKQFQLEPIPIIVNSFSLCVSEKTFARLNTAIDSWIFDARRTLEIQ